MNEVHQPSEPNKSYGNLWWSNKENGSDGISENVYYANGFGGNYIVVDNENDLVVVTRWLEPDKLNAFLKLVTASLDKNE